MAKFTKRSLAVFLLIGMMLIGIPMVTTVASADVVGDTQYNIELVIDKSTSLISTDAENNRYEALRYMFTTLPSSGNEMGALVFNNVVEEVAPIHPIRSQGEKDEMLEQIIAKGTKTGGTDIGTSFSRAVTKLIAKQNEQDSSNGEHFESVVILFTDGLTEGAASDTFSKRDEAIKLAKANNIKVYGVSLNHQNETRNNTEVFDIVRRVRERGDDPLTPYDDTGKLNTLGGSYSEITNASDIMQSFAEIVANLCGGTIGIPEELPVEKTYKIPGVGVSELNLAVRYKAGVLPKIDIEIKNPNGEILPHETTKNVIITKTGVFFNAKIINPDPGLWKITVSPTDDAAKNEKVEVIADVIYNTNVAAKLSYESDGNIKLHEPVAFSSWLEQNGEKVTESGWDVGYDQVVMSLRNYDTQATKEIELKENNGIYIGQATLDDCAGYTAYVTYVCDDLSFASEPVTLQAKNQLPVVSPNPIKDKHSYNWMFGKTYSVNLSKYVTDPEGGELTYSFAGDDHPGAVLESDGWLSVNAKEQGAITLQLRVKDDQDEPLDFEFELAVTNSSLWFTLVLILIILLLIGGALIFLHRFFGGGIDAKVTLTVEKSQVQSIREQMDGDNKPVFLETLGRPPFTLAQFTMLDICRAFIPRVPDEDAQSELEKLFDENKGKLRLYKIKRVPGFDRKRFALRNGSSAADIRKPNEAKEWFVELNDDSVLKLCCEPLKRREKGGKESDF